MMALFLTNKTPDCSLANNLIRQLVLKSQIRIETGDKNTRNEGLILLLCSVVKVSTNTNDFVNQMITENKGFCTF